MLEILTPMLITVVGLLLTFGVTALLICVLWTVGEVVCTPTTCSVDTLKGCLNINHVFCGQVVYTLTTCSVDSLTGLYINHVFCRQVDRLSVYQSRVLWTG